MNLLFIRIPAIPTTPVIAKTIIDFRNSPFDTDEPTSVDVTTEGIRASVAIVMNLPNGIPVSGAK